MSDNTGIEWTDATWTDDRGRARSYHRADRTRPGQQLRRKMAALGMSWCRRCENWLPSSDVRQGACRPHIAEQYREQYAARPDAIRARVQARKRGVAPLVTLARDYLLDQFGGQCAYCSAAASTWDHIVPVSKGGRTEPGNIVPACVSCNSSKKDVDVFEWLLRTARTPTTELYDVLALGVAA